MVTANMLPCAKAENDTELILLKEERREEELLLDFLLYRITLKSGSFYLVSVEDPRAATFAVLGVDRTESEAIFRRLVDGCVTPSTLREIVFDLCEEQEYGVAFG